MPPRTCSLKESLGEGDGSKAVFFTTSALSLWALELLELLRGEGDMI